MRFRVTFAERFDAHGNSSQNPPEFVDVSEGVIRDAAFVQRDEPLNLHVQEVMDEDDSFLSRGTETWEYEIAGGREKEFIEALVNSGMVIEYEELGVIPRTD